MQTLAIVGVGLIGGSIGLALRRAGFQGEILGVSSPATIEEAVRLGAIDRGVDLAEAAGRADVIYLAQPISGILQTITELTGRVRPDCLVTDAGSTKVEIMRAAEGIPLFTGGHPLAGKEARGVSAADAQLFRNRPYVLTTKGLDPKEHPQLKDFVNWLSLCGAVPLFLTPEDHDRIVAFTSHLPQLASTVLATTVGSQLLSDEELRVSGPGLRDATRLALSPWDVWRDIVSTNGLYITHALTVYIDKLTEMRENLQTQQASDEFSYAAEVAGRVRR
jgi:prephenate dehydrogenase